jgi:folate-dependent phosphoribosylglycinamide formyltransferase PurN
MLNGLDQHRSRHGPLRVALLCSHRAPGLLYLLNRCPDRGVTYEIVCCLTSEQTFAEENRVERRGVPTLVHPIREFYGARGESLHDMGVRASYDRVSFDRIEPFYPDVVLLDGYLYLVTSPLLERFCGRIFNLHYSDLTMRHPDGSPLFPGLHAVRDALAAGCQETRATVHLVDEVPDGGAPIVRSWAFPVSPLVEELRSQAAPDIVKVNNALSAYTYAHQEWMMRTVAGPLMAGALRLVASGTVDFNSPGASSDHACWILDSQHALHAPKVELATH